jgi:hypothetical protein
MRRSVRLSVDVIFVRCSYLSPSLHQPLLQNFFFAEKCNSLAPLTGGLGACVQRLLASDVADVTASMPEAKGSKKHPDVLRLG